jgi:predicted MFS family arabinose efflux permease
VVGVLLSMCAIGGLLGAIGSTRLVARFGSARGLIGGILLAGPGLLLGVAAQPGWSTVLVGLGGLLAWFGLVLSNDVQYGYRQMVCPAGLRGRVNATMQVISNAGRPVGALLGGVLGGWLGLRMTVAITAVGAGGSAFWLLGAGLGRHRELPGWVPADD